MMANTTPSAPRLVAKSRKTIAHKPAEAAKTGRRLRAVA